MGSGGAIRDEPNPKERYYRPYANLRGVQLGPGEGRRQLAEEAARPFERRQRVIEQLYK